MKNYHPFLTILLCTLFIPSLTHTQADEEPSQTRTTPLSFIDDTDYISDEDIMDSHINTQDCVRENVIDSSVPTHNNTALITLDPLFIMSALLDIGIIPLLQEDFFLRTNSLNKQSLLDYRLLGNQLCISTCNQVTGCDVFFNQMHKSFYTKHSPSLCSYINLTGETLIERIECCLDRVRELFPTSSLKVNVAKTLGLFQDTALQQRRIGGMFYHVHRHNHALITRFKVPVYYLERNFFLTQQERVAIAGQFGNATAQEEREFRKKYIVSDKIGLGDARLEIERSIFNQRDTLVNAGGYITLPTAFAFHKGLLGSCFTKPTTVPPLTIFETLFNLAGELAQGDPQDAQKKAFNLIKNFLLDGFNRTASLLLDTPLGNNGHVGLGIFLHSHTLMSTFIKKQSAAEIHMVSKLSGEYLFPATEKRYFISKNRLKDISVEDFKNPDDNPTKAAQDLQFIEEEFINRFFLVAHNTRVQPGIIVHANSTFYYQGKEWGWNVGADTWIQTKEILTLKNNPSCQNGISPLNLDKAKSQPFLAYRGSLGGGINYTLPSPKNILNISLNLDATVLNSGIGKDFVLLLKIESHC